MSKGEVLHTRLGDMFELMDCHAIANGAEPKRRAIQSFDDALKVR